MVDFQPKQPTLFNVSNSVIVNVSNISSIIL